MIAVPDSPPWKQVAADRAERARQQERAATCRRAASQTWASLPQLAGPVSVVISYARHSGGCDSANIIGGILDSLQGIAFKNDKQVTQIAYSERPSTTESYTVTIREGDATATA